MARRKKRSGGSKDDAPTAPPTPGDARTSLRGLLKDIVIEARKSGEVPHAKAPPTKTKKEKVSAPAPAAGRPSSSLRGDDRIAYYDAYAGVRPLGEKERRRAATPIAAPSEDASRDRVRADGEARARLAALVGGGVRFEVEIDGGDIRAARAGAAPQVLRALVRRDASPEATLDLHGMRGDDAELEVARFVRAQQRKGARRVCIVHGKGLHSPGGAGVLRDRVVHALSEGGAAPVVLAFATAAPEHGGQGALLVELTR